MENGRIMPNSEKSREEYIVILWIVWRAGHGCSGTTRHLSFFEKDKDIMIVMTENRKNELNLAMNYVERFGVSLKLPLPESKVGLSVVVPVYNEEKLIDRCLEAFGEQTVFNFELIMVNNGSTDRSKDIIKKYSSQEKRFNIYILDEAKKGPGNARRCGMDQAVARRNAEHGVSYIAGTDGDSIPCSTWVEDIYRFFDNSDYNLAAGDIESFWGADPQHEKLRLFDAVRHVTAKFGRPRLRGANFAVRVGEYVRAGGICQPYTKDGALMPGEEGSLATSVENRGEKIGYLNSTVFADPRRLIDNLMQGSSANMSLYKDGVMTDVRSVAYNLSGVSDMDIEDFLGKQTKNIFRKEIFELYLNESSRGLYWDMVKVFLGNEVKRFESDISNGKNDLDYLWTEYGDVYKRSINSFLEKEYGANLKWRLPHEKSRG